MIVAGALSGCGGTKRSAAELGLEREDLTAVAKALKAVEGPVEDEVAATKQAWPLVVNGLPAIGAVGAPPSERAPIATAAERAAKIEAPLLLEEAETASLTGPSSHLASLFRNYDGLSKRGWKLIDATIGEIEHGSPASAKFARENVGLYIESVYDGHFDLAQIAKHLRDGYRELGGGPAFGEALTQGEVNALAETYSEANDRLHPHVGIRFGS